MKRLTKLKIKYFMIVACLLIIFGIIFPTLMRYRIGITANVVGYAKETRSTTYKIKFYNNGGTGTMADMTINYNEAENLTKNTFTRTDYNFSEWNTKSDGSGTSYTDEQEIIETSFVEGDEIKLYAQWVQGVAEINGTMYSTLQEAVDAVPTDNTQTTVVLLTNVSEEITVEKKKNIIFDLRNNTITNVANDKAIIENYGTIHISNGTLRSNATPAAINNNAGGTLKVTGGSIIGTSTNKGQAIYNNGGTVEISGTAYLSSSSTNRATVHHLSSGTLKITGGTIISNNFSAVINDKGSNAVEIGTKDGTVNRTTPVLQGAVYGINITTSGRFKFYDGIIKGKNNAANNESTIIVDKETEYEIAHSEEIIGGATYKTAYLAETDTIIFNPTGGTVDEPTRKIEKGNQIGTLPVPTRTGYLFDGWFTLEQGGEEVLPNRIITDDDTFYAHWTKAVVAEIDGTEYDTLQATINDVPTNNTQTTVKLLRDVDENVSVLANKNIVFDLSNYTISNKTSSAVITNNGTIKITNGTISQTGATAAINNNNTGKIIMTGGRIVSTGGRSAIYTVGSGTVEISGNAYLSSNAAESTVAGNIRGTVMGVDVTGSTIITGGTIISTGGLGISEAGNLTIGIKSDGEIKSNSPVIIGETYGIGCTGTVNFYDGILKGVTDAISCSIADQEPNTIIINGSETIDGKTYKTVHLELDN